MTSFDLLYQGLKVKGLWQYQEALTAQLHFIKDWPKLRERSCHSRPGLYVKEHHGRGGLQSSKENRKSYVTRCVCECVCVCNWGCVYNCIDDNFLLPSWPLRQESWWEWAVAMTRESQEWTMETCLRNAQVNDNNILLHFHTCKPLNSFMKLGVIL